jgi:hypothetical protein
VTIDDLTYPTWRALSLDERRAVLRAIAARVGGAADGGDHVLLDGRPFVFVPGGAARLGWDGDLALAAEQRAAWTPAADVDGGFEARCRRWFGPPRTFRASPLLVERTPQGIAGYVDDVYVDDVESRLRAAVARRGSRLLTNDEWEYAARAGRAGLFPWGDAWPPGAPYGAETDFRGHLHAPADAIALLADPYQVEVVAEPDWVRGGDGGVALCAGLPPPAAWCSFAFPFQHPRRDFEGCLPETYEAAFVRRVVDLATRPRSP